MPEIVERFAVMRERFDTHHEIGRRRFPLHVDAERFRAFEHVAADNVFCAAFGCEQFRGEVFASSAMAAHSSASNARSRDDVAVTVEARSLRRSGVCTISQRQFPSSPLSARLARRVPLCRRATIDVAPARRAGSVRIETPYPRHDGIRCVRFHAGEMERAMYGTSCRQP